MSPPRAVKESRCWASQKGENFWLRNDPGSQPLYVREVLLRNNEQVQATTLRRRTHSPQLTLPPPQPRHGVFPWRSSPVSKYSFGDSCKMLAGPSRGDEPARGSDIGQCCQWMRNHHKNGATGAADLGGCWPNFLEKKAFRRKLPQLRRPFNYFTEITICLWFLVHPGASESWLQTSAQAASASLDSLSPRFALPHATMHHRDTPSEQNPNTPGMWRAPPKKERQRSPKKKRR